MRLPDFLLIGAAKAATTSLYHYLAQHPQVFMSPVKEPGFFALAGHPLDLNGPGDRRVRATVTTTLEAYSALFTEMNGQLAVGEASTIYLESERAVDAIARHLPHVKLIAVLRNPVDRAYSAFRHLVCDGFEPLDDFEAALEAESRRVAAGWYHYWRYYERGFYHRHLSRYFERFDPSQIQVFLYEDLQSDPGAALGEIFRFIGVDPDFRPDLSRRYKVGSWPRIPWLLRLWRARFPAARGLSGGPRRGWRHRLGEVLRPLLFRAPPPLSPQTRVRLEAGYREDLCKLETLIRRNLSHWRLG